MTANIPVLTYGSLRPGCHNYVILEGATLLETTVTVNGFDMYAASGYPYVMDGEGSVEATLNFIHPDFYAEVMEDLDTLEGYHAEGSLMNHYDRILVNVHAYDMDIEAYMYVARNPRVMKRVKTLEKVEDGNWLNHLWSLQELRAHESVSA